MGDSTGISNAIKGWASHPYSGNMDVAQWALFTVLIMTVAIFWSRILKHIVE